MEFHVKGFDGRHGKNGDSVHEVLTNDLFTRYNAELHRFTNKGGAEYSAIYRKDFEEMSCERKNEEDMICAFKARVWREITGLGGV